MIELIHIHIETVSMIHGGADGKRTQKSDYQVNDYILSVRSFDFRELEKYFADSLQFLGQMHFIVSNINNRKPCCNLLLKSFYLLKD